MKVNFAIGLAVTEQVGCHFIRLVWDPPIIDGGSPIYEHEISYSIWNKPVKKGNKTTVSDCPCLLADLHMCTACALNSTVCLLEHFAHCCDITVAFAFALLRSLMKCHRRRC